MKYLIPLIALVILVHTVSFCASYEQPPIEQYIPDIDTITYYDISGSTKDELYYQLEMLGPSGQLAITNYELYYNVNRQRTLTINVIFLRWMPPKDADPDLIADGITLSKTLPSMKMDTS